VIASAKLTKRIRAIAMALVNKLLRILLISDNASKTGEEDKSHSDSLGKTGGG
jgi:hypothetical protein